MSRPIDELKKLADHLSNSGLPNMAKSAQQIVYDLEKETTDKKHQEIMNELEEIKSRLRKKNPGGVIL